MIKKVKKKKIIRVFKFEINRCYVRINNKFKIKSQLIIT